MTTEDLYGKFEIAAELGHRDCAIDFLLDELKSAREELEALEGVLDVVLKTVHYEEELLSTLEPCEENMPQVQATLLAKHSILNLAAGVRELDIHFGV